MHKPCDLFQIWFVKIASSLSPESVHYGNQYLVAAFLDEIERV
jgi:hypothetical protein